VAFDSREESSDVVDTNELENQPAMDIRKGSYNLEHPQCDSLLMQ
jgi:hypothetical protein